MAATSAELAMYGPQFAALDLDRDGLVDGKAVADLLRRSYLPQHILAQVWQMSNPQNRQVFDIGMFAVAMRHVAQAQAAHAQQQAMAASARPIVAPGAPAPGIVAGAAPALAPVVAAAAYQRPPDIVTAPALAQAYAPQIAPEEAAAYGRLFQGLRPTPAGLVSVESAWTIMAKSKLPAESIGRIVKLANVTGDGWLDVKQFAVAMRLINDSLNGQLPALPDRLPQPLAAILSPRAPAPTAAGPAASVLSAPVATPAGINTTDSGPRSRSGSTSGPAVSPPPVSTAFATTSSAATLTSAAAVAAAATASKAEEEQARVLAELEQQISAATAALASAKEAEKAQTTRQRTAQAAVEEEDARSRARAKQVADEEARVAALAARVAELDADLVAHRAAITELTQAQAVLNDLQGSLRNPVALS